MEIATLFDCNDSALWLDKGGSELRLNKSDMVSSFEYIDCMDGYVVKVGAIEAGDFLRYRESKYPIMRGGKYAILDTKTLAYEICTKSECEALAKANARAAYYKTDMEGCPF